MADKRATPETPQQPAQETSRDAQGEPPRNKRAAPTIDLTAKEVPADAATGEAADAPSKSSSGSSPKSSSKSSWARFGIAAGTGAVAVVLALFGLWRGGILPITANSPALVAKVTELEKQVSELQSRPAANADAALAERVGKVEAALAKLSPADPATADKLAAADKAMKSLGLAFTALSHRADDDASANAADARKAADAAAKAVSDLQTSIATTAAGSATGAAQADIEALQQRVAALETQAKSAHESLASNNGNDSAARLALSAQVLRSAVTVGAPYAAELAAVKQLGGDAAALAPLAPFAANGIPHAKALANELAALIPQMEKIAGAPPASANFLERLQANAGSLVSIRPVKAPQGDDASAVLARLEVDAANADVAAALADIGKLPEKVRAAAAGWIEKAKARQAAVAAADRYAATTARALAPQ